MLLKRCLGWEGGRHWFGGRIRGVASWRGLGVTFTDGVCNDCRVRIQEKVIARLLARSAP